MMLVCTVAVVLSAAVFLLPSRGRVEKADARRALGSKRPRGVTDLDAQGEGLEARRGRKRPRPQSDSGGTGPASAGSVAEPTVAVVSSSVVVQCRLGDLTARFEQRMMAGMMDTAHDVCEY